MSAFDQAIDEVLRREGGLIDHPSDPGGITNFGISLRALQQIGDRGFDLDGDGDLDATDIRLMTRDRAVEFYRKHYWFDRLDHVTQAQIAGKVFDMAVNMGRSRATMVTQKAIGWFDSTIKIDGQFGPITLAALNGQTAFHGTKVMLRAIQAEQARFYVDLVAANRARDVFLLGWLRRAFDIV